MSRWTEGTVEVPGIKINYHRTGPDSNKPTIVLLHGFTDNGLCWSMVAQDLGNYYDLIMPDARGHGQTQADEISVAIDLLADDVAALITALELDKPYLFGHSMGASTALSVAARYPELVRAILLEDPPFLDPSAPPRATEEEIEARIKEGLAFQKVSVEERSNQGRAENPGWALEEIIPWAVSKGEYSPLLMENLRTASSGFQKYPWLETLRQVKCPTLLLTAEPEKGAIITPAVADQAAEANSLCKVVKISEAGHCIHRDRYMETMRAVVDFLARN